MWISTTSWLSTTVVKICVALVGMVELRSIRLVKMPPWVSMPSDSGVTSRSTTSLISPRRMPPWIAAPTATTSSGFRSRFASCPKIRSDRLDDQRGPGLPAHQQDLVDFRRPQVGLIESIDAGTFGALHQVSHEVLELRPGQRAGEMARPFLVEPR